MTELTPENAGDLLFGGKAKPDDKPDDSAAKTDSAATTVELTSEQAELADRYGLSPADALRVRGGTWSEKCDDAERLSQLGSANPNSGSLDAYLAAKDAGNRALIEAVHGKPPE